MRQPPLIVLGAGGHAKVVIDLAHRLGRSVLAAVAPHPEPNRQILGVAVKDEDFVSAHTPDAVELALGIGMPTEKPIEGLAARLMVAERFRARGYRFPSLVHPTAIFGEECTIGEGAQIMVGAILQPGCSVGPFAIVNTGARVDHDGVLGEGCHVAPGATLGGNVQVGRETLVGIGATVRQGIRIGARALIGGAAMVTADVADGERRMGVPARSDA
ncbi:MAG TPA: acetyltransferase [Xanthobacteraceae bacterium]|jgi:UDP-perosamine 4-acetyltransferase|nr:acetyltransferase [Xanthobacteraceae bacterium]